MFAQLRNPQLSQKRRRRIDEFCQRLEKLLRFPRMLQAISRLSPVRFISNDLANRSAANT
jgi:hypothetical protein